MAILFDEVLFDPLIVGTVGPAGSVVPITGGPELANADIVNAATGVHKVNVSRFDAWQVFTIPVGLNSIAARDYFNRFWRGGYGSAVGFRFRVPFDFIAVQEVFAVGDGVTTDFYLKKTYTRPGVTARQDVRRITKPVAIGSFLGTSVNLFEANGTTPRSTPSAAAQAAGLSVGFTIYVNGSPVGSSVENTTGRVRVTPAPANGAILSWSGEHDTPMAFVGNSFQMEYNITGKVQGVMIREIPPIELGITI